MARTEKQPESAISTTTADTERHGQEPLQERCCFPDVENIDHRAIHSSREPGDRGHVLLRVACDWPIGRPSSAVLAMVLSSVLNTVLDNNCSIIPCEPSTLRLDRPGSTVELLLLLTSTYKSSSQAQLQWTCRLTHLLLNASCLCHWVTPGSSACHTLL